MLKTCTAATFHADWDQWVAAVVRQGPNRRTERRKDRR